MSTRLNIETAQSVHQVRQLGQPADFGRYTPILLLDSHLLQGTHPLSAGWNPVKTS